MTLNDGAGQGLAVLAYRLHRDGNRLGPERGCRRNNCDRQQYQRYTDQAIERGTAGDSWYV